MAIYGDKEISEGKLKEIIRQELTSGDVSVAFLLSDVIKKELTSGDPSTAPLLLSEIIMKELRKELTSGVEGDKSLLSDIIKNELTSGTTTTMRLSEIIKKELKEELTSGNTTTLLLSDIIEKELTSGQVGTPSLLCNVIREELTSGVETLPAPKSYADSKFFSSDTQDWDGTMATPITANTKSNKIDTEKYGMKTISFKSSAAGTLTIEVQTPATTETWTTYDTISVTAEELETYIISAQLIAVRLSFSADATITAWIVMKYI